MQIGIINSSKKLRIFMNLSAEEKEIILALQEEKETSHPMKTVVNRLPFDEFPERLCNTDFLKECIRTYSKSFGLIPYELRTLELANLCIDTEIKSSHPTLDILKLVEYLVDGDALTYENRLKVILASKCSFRYSKINQYLDIKMLDEICEKASVFKFKFFKKSFTDQITKEQLKSLVDRNPCAALRIKSKNFDSELCARSVEKMPEPESIEEFYNVYKRMNKYLTADIVQSVFDKGFYCSDLMKDIVKFGVKINPFSLYERTLKHPLSTTRAYFKILKDSSTIEELNELFLSYESNLDRVHKKELIKVLKLDIEVAPEVFNCPCCDKPLSQEFIDRIKNS